MDEASQKHEIVPVARFPTVSSVALDRAYRPLVNRQYTVRLFAFLVNDEATVAGLVVGPVTKQILVSSSDAVRLKKSKMGDV